MIRIKLFVRSNPVRVAALVSSLVAVILAIISPDLPIDPVVVLVLSALGLGEYAQRVENAKTVEALYEPAPEE